jgi:hypothetical protein
MPPDLIPTLFSLSLGLVVAFLFAGEIASLNLLIGGFRLFRSRKRESAIRHDSNTVLKSPLAPAVSIVALAPDASPRTLRFIRELANLHFGEHEVLAILDGPSETDLARWLTEFRLFPSSRSASGNIPTGAVNGVYESRDPIRLMVLEAEAGGLANCLNVGLNVAGSPLVAVADPRSTFASDILLQLVRFFLEQPGQVIAACTMVPPPGAGPLPARFQTLECIRAWLGRSGGLAARGVALPAPGAFCLFDRQALRDSNGFFSGAFEMIFHLHALTRARQKPGRVEWACPKLAEPDQVQSMEELRRFSALDLTEIRAALARHWAVLGTFGTLGRVALPGIVLTRVVRPILETIAYLAAAAGLALGWIPWQLPVLLLLCTCVFGMMNTMAAVLMREALVETGLSSRQLFRLFIAAVPENLGYRQLRNLRQIRSLFEKSATAKN